MSPILLIAELSTFFLAIWLGLYLLKRDPAKAPLALTGLGLLAFALALAAELLTGFAPPPTAAILTALHTILIYLPALLWLGTLLALLPEANPNRARAIQLYRQIYLPLVGLLVLLNPWVPLPGWLLALLVGVPLLGRAAQLIAQWKATPSRPPLGLAIIGAIFFGLSAGLFLPFNWGPRLLIVLAIGIDLAVLGFGIAIFDAYQEGHTLRADMWRSFLSAFFTALLFGGQVALAVTLSAGLTLATTTLLLTVISTAVALQIFATPLQAALNPNTESRALHSVADSLARHNPAVDFATLDQEQFYQFTRRALSYLGDLPRLTSSPLTHLPLVTARLLNRQAADNTLARATELKALLTERVERLKPPSEEQFGSSDAWRYYNALYYPYVVGLKPYRRYPAKSELAAAQRQALEWFQQHVPERTLYNWQNAAARLIAQDLLEGLEHKNNAS